MKAALSVNRELICLYWQIWRDLVEKQDAVGWGAKVIDRLARDLQSKFHGTDVFPGPTSTGCRRSILRILIPHQLSHRLWDNQTACPPL